MRGERSTLLLMRNEGESTLWVPVWISTGVEVEYQTFPAAGSLVCHKRLVEVAVMCAVAIPEMMGAVVSAPALVVAVAVLDWPEVLP